MAHDRIPNIGPQSRAWLQNVGIRSLSDLRALGAAEAYVRVKRFGVRASLNLLRAMESALSGILWQEAARRHRTSLLLEVERRENMPP